MHLGDRIGRQIKLHNLEVFMTVVETGSMMRAAKRLNTVQPAVSRSIAELERVFGLRLLDRHRQGITPTAYGRALLDCSTAAFDDLRRGVRNIEWLADPDAGEVRIGSSPLLAATYVPTIVDRISRRKPRVVIHLVTGHLEMLLGELREHKIDLWMARTFAKVRDDRLNQEQLFDDPYVVVARKDLPAANLKELIAWLKANPDKATQGTAGPGSGQHVSGVYFQNVTGTRFQFVPYRAGSSEIMRDLVAGHIDLTFDQAITALPHVRNGAVKAYAVTSNRRLAAAPDIPTVDEAGAPGVYISTWYGLWVPKGTPQDAIRKLTTAAMDALADPAVRERLAGLGQEIPPREQQTAQALAAHHKAEIEKWWPLIKAANIKAE